MKKISLLLLLLCLFTTSALAQEENYPDKDDPCYGILMKWSSVNDLKDPKVALDYVCSRYSSIQFYLSAKSKMSCKDKIKTIQERAKQAQEVLDQYLKKLSKQELRELKTINRNLSKISDCSERSSMNAAQQAAAAIKRTHTLANSKKKKAKPKKHAVTNADQKTVQKAPKKEVQSKEKKSVSETKR